jgi:pimeloyl-ACP methyl ester carboxylesterase
VVKPVLLPLAERLGRLALKRRGVRSRRVATPHAELHAYDAPGKGSLPTTVLLHGLGSAATAFGPLVSHLRRDVRRVVAPEFPGHGFSDETALLTPDALFGAMAHALDTLLDEPAIVVGNSLGGAVALTYAILRPERVRALVLVSPAGAHSTREEWDELRATFHLKTTKDARAFMDRIYHRTPWFLPLLAHEFPATLGRQAVRDLFAAASNEHLPTPDALAALPMPILLLWGQSERLLPESHLAYFTRHLPKHAIIERPEGFAHCPHFDDPAALAARIVAFAKDAGVHA